ncbi:MAG: hydrogenase iron-sulfur subunit [Methanosarcinaceae archaeon]|nr:hydrogenase iron-sulfur subunit [Methanosarcinaceae archaeon]
MTDLDFEPNILTFCCNWCSYAGADLAGVSRLQYPANNRIVRVMCSSRIEPTFILEAFKEGADGVLITGCHIGDCHYIEGNEHTDERMKDMVDALERMGLNGRLHLEWVSAAEGKKFQETMINFVDKIKALGPSPLKHKRVE